MSDSTQSNKARLSGSVPASNPPFPPPPPRFFRLPKPGTTDPHFGGSRSYWNEKILPMECNGFKPPVRSVVERKRGAKRGIRFISFVSAVGYFQRLELEQNQTAQEVS